MSRAYRITVQDSVRKVVCADDHVSTQLEVLEVLPCEQMAELLAAELEKLGFDRDGQIMTRHDSQIRVSIDILSGTVTVAATGDREVMVEGKKSQTTYDDRGESPSKIKQELQTALDAELDERIDERQSELQTELTDRLEAALADIRSELDQASNRATAAALKQKAAQLGQIKELTEDPETGSMTIVVEL